jgi:5-methylcytosine-specific restriction protein B
MSEYPFSSLDSFETVRSTAMANPAAAAALLRLRASAGGRSTVRLYYGPPGTGKTLMAVQTAVKLADPAFADIDNFSACFRHFAIGPIADQVAFVTFHQALQYEDVVESIRPSLSNIAAAHGDRREPGSERDPGTEDPAEDTVPSAQTASPDGLTYELHEGPLLRLIDRAMEHDDEEHVLVIDEINRGDISRILGPLISSIEADKRAGAEYPIGFESQYPKGTGFAGRIFVPSNLHIIGTMNSADRNIALVDYALRRRFEFVELPPNSALLGSTGGDASIDVAKLLETINNRVTYLLDKDHAIGHGYLMGCTSTSELIERVARRVLPLLAEYFYGNEAALLLVVGDEIGADHNIFEIEELEASFEQVFGRSIQSALALGHRTQHSRLALRVDPRFWDVASVPPAPGDLAYATGALRKIYAATAVEDPAASGPTQATVDSSASSSLPHREDADTAPDAE